MGYNGSDHQTKEEKMNATMIICTVMICVTVWLSLLTLVLHSVWQTKTARVFAIELVKMLADSMNATLEKWS